MKILGIDHGQKKCGIANAVFNIASPYKTVLNNELITFFKKEGVNKDTIIVYGLPLSMSGRFSNQTYNVIKSAIEVKTTYGCKIIFIDERLTSKTLFTELKGVVKSKKIKKTKDQNSSSLILSVYLANKNAGIELKEKKVYNIVHQIKSKKTLVYETAIKNIKDIENFYIFTKDPWIFWYYFSQGIKSINIEKDLEEYDVLICSEEKNIDLKYNEKMCL
ncbi:putative pre-16S rRNA nuclease [Tepiditoga spiralis]|uniref:Putative pre-16S rRNA nuclease n=1 Tax=Tepiditoga spiralis TaxID=2108365 RepID=A0A7G1G412_9BACT|nr:Holliday junction resolvase RuvX [Tepiditoga spiralis]BBE29946.1 putative pre-16S rRNA nuclease [Tepiditoga spiralis]